LTPELGIIEGFYGKPWSWEARKATAAFLAPHGYRFYMYAPKGDPYLRRRWQEPHPQAIASGLADLAQHCRDAGVRFGIGLSPYEIYLDFGESARAALQQKLDFFDALGVQDLAVLFDDMRGDSPELAELQVQIVHWVAERASADRIFVCPTYYSDDPVLDRVFGVRPENYLEQLGAELDPAIQMFWTGEEVCSRELSPGHLNRVAAMLARKPFLWDNYPVNDGQRMSRYLHLRGFTGRPSVIGDHVAGHGINPALQPVLSRIPALTLADSYRLGTEYRYGAAFRNAAIEVLGEDLGIQVWEDLLTFQDVGLERLDEKQRAHLRDRYGRSAHEGAREIIGWLEGAYAITNEVVLTQ
jgi:hyaluronoglucosaminidase